MSQTQLRQSVTIPAEDGGPMLSVYVHEGSVILYQRMSVEEEVFADTVHALTADEARDFAAVLNDLASEAEAEAEVEAEAEGAADPTGEAVLEEDPAVAAATTAEDREAFA